jgi:hypothetical protein
MQNAYESSYYLWRQGMKWNTNLTILTVLFVSAFAVFAQSQISGHERPLEILSQELVLLEAKEAKESKIGMDYIQIRQSYPTYNCESRAELDRQFARIGKLRIQMQDESVQEIDLKNVRKVILEPMADFDIKKNPPSRFKIPEAAHPE